MEDLASEFQDDFLEAVKVLEDFSSSDNDLREALREIRKRVDAKTYVCAPNFWEDLRETLGTIVQQRDERAAKSKAQQVLKQIARLEVKFWAKESVGMLRELDPDSRLERIIDWIQTFEAGESADQSSGPAVLYQVLNDISLQKDMETFQRDSLTASVRENLHKFPVEMQAVLERVGSLPGGGAGRVLSDWRRRNQPTTQESSSGGTRLTFVPAPKLPLSGLPVGNAAGGSEVGSAGAPAAGVAAGSGLVAGTGGEVVPPLPAANVDGTKTGTTAETDMQADEEEAPATEPFNIADVDPNALERAKRAVIAMLESNSGEYPRQFVRTLLKQVGVSGLPIAALGDEVFFSGTEVFLRRTGAPAPPPAKPAKSPIPDELRTHMISIISEAGGRMVMSQFSERLQWHAGSVRHSMHGPLRRAVAQVPELFFEPQKVFMAQTAKRLIASLPGAEEEEEPAPAPGDTLTTAAPFISDPFAEFNATILAWLHQADGVLSCDVVLPLVKTLGFKPRAVISALSREVFWSHPEAECEILLRTGTGAVQHPRPLPSVYLHQQVHQNLVEKVKAMGSKAKLDKLAGSLGWNAKSELKKAYGTLKSVLMGLREIFYDPTRLYLKKALDGVVDWPVNRDGRVGPREENEVVTHWTSAADDLKGAVDPEWLNMKRQIIGTIMSNCGQCEVAVLRQVLQPLEGVELEALFQEGSKHDLSSVLFWSRDHVYCCRPEAVVSRATMDDQVSAEVKQVLISHVRAHGSASLSDLKRLLDESDSAVRVDENQLFNAAQRIPELVFVPDFVFLRHVIKPLLADPIAAQEMIAPVVENLPPAMPETSEAALAQDQTEGQSGAASLLGNSGIADVENGGDDAGESGNSSSGTKFFSFNEFAPAQEAPIIERPPVKKQRLNDADPEDIAGANSNWNEEAPPWATAGAAVMVRSEQADASNMSGVVVKVRGTSCTVRLLVGDRAGLAGQGGLAGGGFAVERDFPTSALLPVVPTVGAMVKVVAGDRLGCHGTMVGLAGSEGVVQIGKMSYETVPMSQLAVLAT